MYLNEAKIKLLNAGYRLIKESDDNSIYVDVASILSDDGYTDTQITDMLEEYQTDIESAVNNGDSAFEIAAMIEGFEENNSYDDETEEIELGGDRFDDYVDPDEYMEESKSNKQKTDKFDRKAKLAGKKKSCCGKKNCKDCDEDAEELDEGILQGIKDRLGDRKINKDIDKSIKYHNDNIDVYKKANNYDDETQNEEAIEKLRVNIKKILISARGQKTTVDSLKNICSEFNDLGFNINTKIVGSGAWNKEIEYYAEKYENEPLSNVVRILIKKYIEDQGCSSLEDCIKKEVETMKKKFQEQNESYNIDEDYDEDVDDVKHLSPENKLKVQGIARNPRGQQGTEDWSDFRDDFRAQTLILKKTLTPKFVSGLIKDMDFEIDAKDIKDVAVKMLSQVKDTKNPVENLQARIRKFFTK